MARQTILIDADDTLWENNVFFEKTIENLIAHLEPLGYTHDYIRHILNETELRNIRQHGYGIRCFRRSLGETYGRLAGSLARQETLAEIELMAQDLERVPVKIMEGVPETLAYLSSRHRLIMLTKGEAAEQAGKIERSGLQTYFDAIEIVPEKDQQVYERIVNQFHIVKSCGWMIGNSPRSDVNPALHAGLNVAFIPHHRIWQLEHAELESGIGRLLIVASFRDLRAHF